MRQKVKSGSYTSSSEVVREALRLLDERDRLREIQRGEPREAIQKGLESDPAGTLDIEAVKAKGRNLLANGYAADRWAPSK